MALDIDGITESIVSNFGNTESTEVEATPVESTAEVTPTPTAPPVQEDPSIEVDFDGDKRKLTAKEIRDGYLRQQDYTRKTTELARVRKAAETVAQAYEQQQRERAEFADFMSDHRKVAQYMAKQFGPDAVSALLENLQGQQAQNPNEPVTLDRVEQLSNQKFEQLQRQQQELEAKFQQTLEERLQQERQSIESQRARTEYDRVLNPFVDKLLSDNPVLQAIDNVETLIRFKVLQSNPQTVEEAKSAFEKIVKTQVEKLQSKFVETNKQTLINKEKLKQGIEPPGGGGIAPQPKSYTKGRRVDWDALEADAITSLRGR